MKKRAAQTRRFRPPQGATGADAAHGAPQAGPHAARLPPRAKQRPARAGRSKAVSGAQPPNRPVIQSQMRAKNPGSSSTGSGEGAGVTRGT